MSADVPLDELLEKVKEAISKQSPGNSDNNDKKQFKCPHSFGYLSKMPKGNPIPEECFLCPKVVECLASL
ncbi:MAG: hypothetical protein IAX21_07515 [Candidatus Bathyarchaeota archaeon]|nr:MAG: hypothetical protein IAX21_07515 [Candidatus Bathyarchaeota archaeon]